MARKGKGLQTGKARKLGRVVILDCHQARPLAPSSRTAQPQSQPALGCNVLVPVGPKERRVLSHLRDQEKGCSSHCVLARNLAACLQPQGWSL